MKGKKKYWFIAAALVALLAVVCVVIGWRYVTTSYDGDEACWVYVPDGSSESDIDSILGDALGAAGTHAARIMHFRGDGLSRAHGAYRIEPGATAVDIYRRVSRGIQTPVKLTFNNLRTMPQLAARVGDRFETDSASFMAACREILNEKGFNRATDVAAFLPDTYEFYWTASPSHIVTTLLGYRDRFWNDERRAKAKALGLTPVEVATIASIAEEETNDRAERGIVARLYINRLQCGMLLQADPTVKFAVGDFGLRRITASHLAVNSPYNTYKVAGLPPGPIRMPDRATLDAVLDSKPHGYLYMCAKEDFSGRHNFATDYASHQRNATRYRNELNRRNIK